MFSDPQSINLYDDGAQNLPRTGLVAGVGTFTAADGLSVALVRQTATKTRKRHELRITTAKISADPLSPDVNTSKSFSVYFVVDEPLVGFTHAEITDQITALQGWISSQYAKLLGGEY